MIIFEAVNQKVGVASQLARSPQGADSEGVLVRRNNSVNRLTNKRYLHGCHAEKQSLSNISHRFRPTFAFHFVVVQSGDLGRRTSVLPYPCR